MGSDNKKSFFGRYWFVIVGVILIIIIFLCLRSCNKSSNLNAIPKDVSLAYYAMDVNLIPQKGSLSCWAATLNMFDPNSNFSLNDYGTSAIRSSTLSSYLSGYINPDYEKLSEPSWNLIKKHIEANKNLITYKYFNEQNAHVFLVRGFQETSESKWLIVNDPWPMNKGKITALAFNQFISPFNGENAYEKMPFTDGGSGAIIKNEPSFNIFSETSLKDTGQIAYLPPKKTVLNNYYNIKDKDLDSLSNFQLSLFKKFNTNLYKTMFIDFDPKKDKISFDKNEVVRVNNFSNTAAFLDYDIAKNYNSSYLFDGEKLAYVTIKKGNKNIINVTLEIKNSGLSSIKTFLYVSKFENYQNSDANALDSVKKAFKKGLSNPNIKKLLTSNNLNKLKRSENQKSSTVSEESKKSTVDEVETDIKDFSVLPLPGGMAFSFIYPPFEERIVADPYQQLKIKPGKRPLFISDGIPFYRLSSIKVPIYNEIVQFDETLLSEWQIARDKEEDTIIEQPINPVPKPKPVTSTSPPKPKVPITLPNGGLTTSTITVPNPKPDPRPTPNPPNKPEVVIPTHKPTTDPKKPTGDVILKPEIKKPLEKHILDIKGKETNQKIINKVQVKEIIKPKGINNNNP